MSTPEINQVLAQMRVVQAQATGAAGGIGPADATAKTEFSDLLTRAITSVNETQQTANELRTAFERGEQGVELNQVMIAAQKSSLSFQAMVEVRNKLVEAYTKIMNMPV